MKDMIKKFNLFIRENIEFGEYVENHMKDENINRLILPFIKNQNKDLKISNIINTLDQNKKNEIKNIINNYLKNGLISKANIDVNVSSVVLENSGKGVFNTFLKALSAISVESISKKIKKDFLLFYITENIEPQLINEIFNRFKSLSHYISDIDINEKVSLFYGINYNLILEYGLIIQDNKYVFGKYKLNNSSVEDLKNNTFKSGQLIKKDLESFFYTSLQMMSKIVNDSNSIPIIDFKKKSEASIVNSNLKIGYYGLGTWKNGEMEEDDFLKFKELVNNWITKSKWKDNVLYKAYCKDFWFIVEIKIK
jgi:hypothetical protein